MKHLFYWYIQMYIESRIDRRYDGITNLPGHLAWNIAWFGRIDGVELELTWTVGMFIGVR